MNDEGSILAVEGILVALLVVGAVLFVTGADTRGAGDRATPDALESVAADALSVLAGLPSSDGEARGFLREALPAALAGDAADLTSKLARLFPAGAAYNLHLDNGVAARDVVRTGEASGERVSTSIAIRPEWSALYATTAFKVHASGAGTDMDVTAWPVWRGQLLDGEELVPNGAFEVDGDSDGVPDDWALDPAASGAIVLDPSTAWSLDRGSAGVAAAGDVVRVEGGATLRTQASIKGVASCVQLRYLDASLDPVDVGGAATRCVATLATAEPAVWTDLDTLVTLGEDPDLAYVRVELAHSEAGNARFARVSIEPAVRAEFSDASVVRLPEPGADGAFTAAVAGTYPTGVGDLQFDLDVAHRGDAASRTLTYRTEAAPLVVLAWPKATTGLAESTVSLDAASVPADSAIEISYDFAPYSARLAEVGVTLVSPVVHLRVYEPVPRADGGMQLVAEVAQPTGQLTGAYGYAHAPDALFGTHLVVASVSSGWTDGTTTVAGQVASLGATYDSKRADAASSAAVYRLVVEAWLPDWG